MTTDFQQNRIDNETIRRANEGDFSDYVKGQLEGAVKRQGVEMPQQSDYKAGQTSTVRIGAPGDGMEGQEQALNLINRLDETPSWPELQAIKEQLVGIPAITTDKDEKRNMYQYAINEMLRAGKNPRGAQLLDVSQIPLTDEGDRWRRTGGTTFTDPTNPSFGRDLGALFSGDNPGVFNLKDQDNEGLAGIVPFQPGWAQGDESKGEGLGITDYGELMEGLVTGATPFKYAKMLGNYIKDSDLYGNAADTLHNVGVGALETAIKPVHFLQQGLTEQIDRLFNKKTKK